jgi:catechol 2,3-dioxygenase-like lactoylglutathione lyase family enzyme
VEPRVSFITLGVTDLARAIRFYEQGLGLSRLKTPPSVAFFELGKTWLALWGRESLADDADALLAQAAKHGGKITKAGHRTDWGGYAGYFADPDGFLWEVAHNPDFPHA